MGNEVHFKESLPTESKAAQLSALPRYWINVKDGTRLHVRIEGDLVYAEGQFPADGGYINSGTLNCAGEKVLDKWIGKCRYTLQMVWGLLWNRPTCYVTTNVEITSLSPRRIEGELQMLAPGRDLRECPVPGDTESRFTLIPAEPPD